MKLRILVSVALPLILSASAITESSPATDNVALEQFFQMNFLEEEYGYVLEGLKPISIRNYYPIEEIPPFQDLSFAKKELLGTIFVNKAVEAWEKSFSNQKKFVFKAAPIKSVSGTGWEVRFINVPKLRETIRQNINLFQQLLGPKATIDQLVSRLAFSHESFDSILKNHPSLIGIVLGFGSHNSVIGGRLETIAQRIISKDVPPFRPNSEMMFSAAKHSLNTISPLSYGGYYFEYAGGDDSYFRHKEQPNLPSEGFSSLEEEVTYLDRMNDPDFPLQLFQKPPFIFQAYRGDSSNKRFFDQLVQSQKKILNLVNQPNLLDLIFGKARKKDQTKPFKNNRFETNKWVNILHSIAKSLENKEEQQTFLDSYCNPTKDCQSPMIMAGATQAMLRGAKKAISNLEVTDSYFSKLSQKDNLNVILPNRIYSQTKQPGSGKKLNSGGRVRMGYVIEDLHENILFANCDIWLELSQVIPGLAHGIQGMQVGEKRTLYIHPEYAYGALTTLPPCSGLIIKTHLIDIEEENKTLTELKALDVAWIKDSNFITEIESSLKQKPKYLGFMYRTLFDQIQELDQSEVLAKLDQERSKPIDRLEP